MDEGDGNEPRRRAGTVAEGQEPSEAPLGWPFVDRRQQNDGTSPSGIERRHTPTGTRLEQLSAANELLVALHEVAQTLPTSLDLDDVLDSLVAQVRALVGGDVVTVLLRDATDGSFLPVRGKAATVRTAEIAVPEVIRAALPRTGAALVDGLESDGGGFSGEATCGLYAIARARGHAIGLVATESQSSDSYGPTSAETLTALVESFAVAVDNARLFRRVRTVAADEERRRLARDVHDRIGSSVAMLGFEVDRIMTEVDRGASPDPLLRTLRQQISGVVGEVRETLNDLRTEVTDERDLPTTLQAFLDRLGARSGLFTTLDVDASATLPRPQEREIWRMALEALVNVERHSGASEVRVAWRCDDETAELVIADNGKGLQPGASRADSYGLTGMRERAAAIGARLQVTGSPETGTTVTIRMGQSASITQNGRGS